MYPSPFVGSVNSPQQLGIQIKHFRVCAQIDTTDYLESASSTSPIDPLGP